jgi:hypothetical protein
MFHVSERKCPRQGEIPRRKADLGKLRRFALASDWRAVPTFTIQRVMHETTVACIIPAWMRPERHRPLLPLLGDGHGHQGETPEGLHARLFAV